MVPWDDVGLYGDGGDGMNESEKGLKVARELAAWLRAS